MKRVFVDTSAWYAFANAKDAYHDKARKFLVALDPDTFVVTSISVIAELLSVLRVRIGVRESIVAQELLLSEKRNTIEFHQESDLKDATELFRNSPRHASFVDCLNVATMKRLQIEDILTFDPWFKTFGLNILP